MAAHRLDDKNAVLNIVMPFDRHYFLPLRNTAPLVYRGLDELVTYVEHMATQLGVEPRPAAQVAESQSIPPPLPANSFAVTGVDGHFHISIANNSGNRAPVLHELASSTDSTFPPENTTTYGPESRLEWDIAAPGATFYWRLRSRFYNSGFGSTLYAPNGPASPAPISAGLLRSSSTSVRQQRSAHTLVVWAEFVASGGALSNGDTSDGTPTVNWSAATIFNNGGTGQISVPKTTIRGLAVNTTYAVLWDSSAATARLLTNASSALADTQIYLATVQTPATSGDAASSAGGGATGLGVTTNGGRYTFI